MKFTIDHKIVFGLALGLTGPAMAGGFQISERNSSDLGRAYAGGAAVAEDASTIAANPAGLVKLQKAEAVFSASAVSGEVNVEIDSAGVDIPNLGLQASSGKRTDNAAPSGTSVIPAVYASYPISEDIVIGLGAFSNFSTATKYDENFVANILAVESEVTTININPSIGYRINDKISVGFGLNAVLAEATLSSANPAVGPLTLSTGQVILNPANGQAVVAPNGGSLGYSEIKGNDIGFGWNLGMMVQATDSLRIGASYRSNVDLELDGTVEFKNTPDVDSFQDINGKAPMDLPELAQLSAHYQINSSLSLSGDISYTGWSRFKKLQVLADNGAVITEVPENWKDSNRYAVGITKQYNESWTFKGGIAYDESPIPDEFRTLRIPTSNFTWYALGTQYEVGAFTIDGAYALIVMDDTTVEDERTFQGQSFVGVASGKVDARLDVFSLQATYRL